MTDFKGTEILTPIGEANYACIMEPVDNYNKDGKEYRCGLILDRSDEFIGFIDTLIETSYAKAVEEAKTEALKKAIVKAYPYRDELNDEVPTGRVIVNFKKNSHRKNDDGTVEFRPLGVFDSQGREIPTDIKCGNGSKIRIKGISSPYYSPGQAKTAGITLRMFSVQVIDLVEFKGGGFDPVEGGYQVPETEEDKKETQEQKVADMFNGEVSRATEAELADVPFGGE